MRTRFLEPRDPFDDAASAEEAAYKGSLLLVPSSVRLSSSWLASVLSGDGDAEPAAASRQLFRVVGDSPTRLEKLAEQETVAEGCYAQLLLNPATLSLRFLEPKCVRSCRKPQCVSRPA